MRLLETFPKHNKKRRKTTLLIIANANEIIFGDFTNFIIFKTITKLTITTKPHKYKTKKKEYK